MDFVDCYAVVGSPSGPGKGATPDGLIPVMDRHGIQQALVFHRAALTCDPMLGNDELLKSLRGSKRFVPCFVLAPDPGLPLAISDDLCELVSVSECAVRMYPTSHHFSLSRWMCGDLLDLLDERYVPLFIDLDEFLRGTTYDLDAIDDLCTRRPRIPIVLTRMDNRAARSLLRLLQLHSNLYIDTSTMLWGEGLDWVAERAGATHLLFGTGMPDCDPGGSRAMLEFSRLSDEDKARVAAGNLLRLIRRER